jgi:hypothetical protein
LGVCAVHGGQHPGRGTRNALLAIGEWSYLEIVGPDPLQPSEGAPRWFMVDDIPGPRLVTWAVKAAELDNLVKRARRRGVLLGSVAHGKRVRSDGVVLSWQFTDPAAFVVDGLVPFFINWGSSPHPAATAPRGVQLISLRVQHPEPRLVEHALSVVGLNLAVEHGLHPSLIATLRTPKGVVELH